MLVSTAPEYQARADVPDVQSLYADNQADVKSQQESTLGDVEIRSILTTKDHELEVKWNAVTNAQIYNIYFKQKDVDDFTELASGLTDTSYTISSDNLTVGETYTIKVEAVNGETTKVATMNKKVSESEDRFIGGFIGSGASGTITENENGSVTLNATGGKLADSEDGFLYYYTEIDPKKENFVIRADFHVEDSENKEKTSGFGIMAVDTLVDGDSNAKYFNSAGSMVRKYMNTENGSNVSLYGAPGGYFVTGYKDAPSFSSSNRTLIDTAPFDWNWKSDYVTDGPKFEAGETYTLILKKDNTGYKASMIDPSTGEESKEIICYEPDLLLKQDSSKYYVGFAVARNISVSISNIHFSTSDPATDALRVERPKTEVVATPSLDSTTRTSNSSYQAAFKTDYKGTIEIIDTKNQTVEDKVTIDPTNATTFRATANLNLEEGDNTFKAIFTPAEDSEQGDLLQSSETMSLTPIEINFTITYKKYGTSDNAIYVAPNGTSGNTGTKVSPLDIYTAVAYAQPGQEIILTGGTYKLESKIDIERGNNGTASNMITLMSDPNQRARLDLTNSNGGIILQGDYWHIYNIEICNSQNISQPMVIRGNNNIIEKVVSYNNKNTGIQISGLRMEPFALWPSNNLVLSCESYNNCDLNAKDADGFAAKLTVGEGNVFKYCISHHNIDDGWDLYTKSETGVIGEVVIDQCVAYENGHLTADTGNTKTEEGNGFNLGGESVPVKHRLKNSISFNNLANGVFSNSNPSVCVENTTSYQNGIRNLCLDTNASSTSWNVNGFVSYKGTTEDSYELIDQLQADAIINYFTASSTPAVTDDWFDNLDTSVIPSIAEDGSIDMHGLLTLKDTAYAGAVITANPNPTVIEIGQEIKSGSGTATVIPTTSSESTTTIPVPTPTPSPSSVDLSDAITTELEIKVTLGNEVKDTKVAEFMKSVVTDTENLQYCLIDTKQLDESDHQKLKVNCNTILNTEPGDKVYVYVYNQETNQLESRNRTTYTVNAEGNIGFMAYRNETMVILSEKAANVVPRAAQTTVEKVVTLEKSETMTLQPIIKAEYKYKIGFISSNKNIVTVSKDGIITCKNKGTVRIATYVKIGGVTAKFYTKVTVK